MEAARLYTPEANDTLPLSGIRQRLDVEVLVARDVANWLIREAQTGRADLVGERGTVDLG